MSPRLLDLVRRQRRPQGSRGLSLASGGPGGLADLEGRVCSDLAVDLPDEDLREDLTDCLDMYELGSKPRCEEVEYLDLVQEAIDRIARGH